MKKIFTCFLLAIVLTLSSCGLKEQKNGLESLAKCKFQIKSIKEMTIADTPLDKIVSNGNIDIGKLPNVAIAAFQKKIPLEAIINLEITNPTDSKASIDEFEYIILFENNELANGTVNQQISVPSKEALEVPIHIKGEVYNLLFGSDKALLNFLLADNSSKANFTIKVKPTITVAGQKVKYPGFISFEKQINREVLFK